MSANPSNQFLATAAGAAAADSAKPKLVEKPAETETETPPAGDEPGDEDEDEEEDPPADPVKPETPTADPNAAAASQTPTAPPRLSAFDRGALRLLGKGDLIARLERAETEAANLSDANATLTAENARLTSELNSLREETPKKIEAAAKGRANEVSKGVAAELQALGVTQEAAPSAVGADSTPEGMLEHFHTLKGAERIAYLRANKQKLLAAEAAVNKSKSK